MLPINTGCRAVGVCIFKTKFEHFVHVYILPTQQKARTYSRKGGSKLHAASVNALNECQGKELIRGMAVFLKNAQSTSQSNKQWIKASARECES